MCKSPERQASVLTQFIVSAGYRRGSMEGIRNVLDRTLDRISRLNDPDSISLGRRCYNAAQLVFRGEASTVKEALDMIATPKPVEIMPGQFWPYSPSRYDRLALGGSAS